MDTLVAVGVDLGGTNLKGVVVGGVRNQQPGAGARADGVWDRSNGVWDRLSSRSVLARKVRPIDDHSPQAVIAAIAGLVGQVLSEASVKRSALIGVGVGAPGPLSRRTGRIIRCPNLPGWVDVPLRDLLEEELQTRVVLENDGNAAAFGEFWAGLDRRCQDLVMLTLGTGVGAGVVIGGRLLHGHADSAAELGHMIVVADGLPCPCGQRGCLEQYASAGAVARRVAAAIQAGETSVLSDQVTKGKDIAAEDVVRCARHDDALCARIWEDACRYLGVACINIQHAYDPSCIVLGGGMTRAGTFLIDRVKKWVAAYAWALRPDIPVIQPATLGYDAGAIGAAGLIWNAEQNTFEA